MANIFTDRGAPARPDVRGGGHGVGTMIGRPQFGKAAPDFRQRVKTPGGTFLNPGIANELLSALSEDEFARLGPYVEQLPLRQGQVLYQYGESLQFAYFPESGVVSHLHVLADGSTTETAIIGRDGMIGLSAVFNVPPPSYLTQVAVTGSALRVRADALRQEFLRGGAVQRTLLAYANARMRQLSQKAVCNGHHKVSERLCTWLLMIHDRAESDRLTLTHEQIAAHMGVRRAGVTIAASALRDERAIDNGRGLIRILDRAALEASACECYRVLDAPTKPRPLTAV